MKFSINDLDAGQLAACMAALGGSPQLGVSAAAPLSPAPSVASAPVAAAPAPIAAPAAVAAPAAIPTPAPIAAPIAAPTPAAPAPVAAPAAPAVPAGAPSLDGVIAAMGQYVKAKAPNGAALVKQILTGRYQVAKAAEINPAHYADAISVFSGQIDPFAAA